MSENHALFYLPKSYNDHILTFMVIFSFSAGKKISTETEQNVTYNLCHFTAVILSYDRMTCVMVDQATRKKVCFKNDTHYNKKQFELFFLRMTNIFLLEVIECHICLLLVWQMR